MKFIKSKKAIALLAVSVAAVVAAVAGYAYFTASGSGTGSATVGNAVNQIVVAGTAPTALTPGNSSAVSFKAWNYANQGQAISSITLSGVAACSAAWSSITYDTYGHATTAPTCGDTGQAATDDTACAAEGFNTDAATSSVKGFSMLPVSVDPTGDGHLAANASAVSLTEGGTLTLNDLNSNQNACQGKNLLLSFTTG
jgi:hypothetical protein